MCMVDDSLSGPKPLWSKGDSNRQVNFPSDLFLNVHEPEAVADSLLRGSASASGLVNSKSWFGAQSSLGQLHYIAVLR